MDSFHRGIVNLFTTFFPIKIYGKENIPKGKAIFVCNHFSGIDCGYVAKFYGTDIKFLAKKELFKFKPYAKVIKRFGAIPIDRENPNLDSIIKVLKYLKAGHKICIFAEGKRNKTKTTELQELKSGFILFAIKAAAPIVPVMLIGKGKMLKKQKLIIGKPIEFTDYYGLKLEEQKMDELNQIVRKEMIRLQEVLFDINLKKNGKVECK